MMNLTENQRIPTARRRIAKIRCLYDCLTSLKDKKPLPSCLCYVASEVDYLAPGKTTWKIQEKPRKNSKVILEINAVTGSRIVASGEELCNKDGKWLRVLKTRDSLNSEFCPQPSYGAWLLLYSNRSSTEDTPNAVPMSDDIGDRRRNQGKKQGVTIRNWQSVVEETYAPVLKKHKSEVIPFDQEAVSRLQIAPEGWGLEHDSSLVNLMSQNIPKDSEGLGCLKEYVEALGVSTYSPGDGESSHLTDNDPMTYWETDGSQGLHWIRLNMKKGTIIKLLALTVDLTDDNYLPEKIVVLTGESEDFKELSTVNINWTYQYMTEIKLLENLTEHYSTITIKIKSCKSHGIDTRIRGIILSCLEERCLGFDEDFFAQENLVKYPKLQPYSSSVLYRRSIVLQRFMSLLDSVIHYLVPSWQVSVVSFDSQGEGLTPGLESVRQLLLLSKKRMGLIENLLKGSASDPSDRKVVYINRHAAHEHRSNPTTDYSNTVFMQLYEGLRPRDRSSSPLTYRWSVNNDQWWECKFVSEGIIDQGGGFRDSLSDLGEELCPSDPDAPMALPYFIRSPNQNNDDGNVNKDMYIPNPACGDLAKYEWIGQLMGACFRGKEILIMALAPYIWKRLFGHCCGFNWSEDFSTVDASEVKIIDSLESMDCETFKVAARSWSMVLSDGTTVQIKVDHQGNSLPLAYDDRVEYAAKVREIRMSECDKQLKAMRTGLLKVIPEAVLDLLTWQELESRICGEPEISVEALKKNTYYTLIDENDARIEMFWAAIKNFSNEDRSHLLKFITGRKRLPVSIFITAGKNSPMDPLPESSTCCNTLHLPMYSTEKIAEERLRYAAYNCVSIDTDE